MRLSCPPWKEGGARGLPPVLPPAMLWEFGGAWERGRREERGRACPSPAPHGRGVRKNPTYIPRTPWGEARRGEISPGGAPGLRLLRRLSVTSDARPGHTHRAHAHGAGHTHKPGIPAGSPPEPCRARLRGCPSVCRCPCGQQPAGGSRSPAAGGGRCSPGWRMDGWDAARQPLAALLRSHGSPRGYLFFIFFTFKISLGILSFAALCFFFFFFLSLPPFPSRSPSSCRGYVLLAKFVVTPLRFPHSLFFFFLGDLLQCPFVCRHTVGFFFCLFFKKIGILWEANGY